MHQNDVQDWSRELREELRQNDRNGHVGSVLVSETADVRVWQIDLAPGARLPFHRHVLDYFWTCLTEGSARSHFGDGRIAVSHYSKGDTRHFRFASGESMIHDLENIGETTLVFATVEFLDSANPALPVDAPRVSG